MQAVLVGRGKLLALYRSFHVDESYISQLGMQFLGHYVRDWVGTPASDIYKVSC